MPECVVKQDCRVNGVIVPWPHQNPIPMRIRAGKTCEVNEAGKDGVVALFRYPRHTVTATLPATAVGLLSQGC